MSTTVVWWVKTSGFERFMAFLKSIIFDIDVFVPVLSGLVVVFQWFCRYSFFFCDCKATLL